MGEKNTLKGVIEGGLSLSIVRTRYNTVASMRRTLLTISLIGLLCGILGCDRFEDDEGQLDEQLVDGRMPTEGTFVATVVGEKSVGIAGPASFRIPVLSRNLLSLDFVTDAVVPEGSRSTGVFLSTTWRQQAEEKLPSTGYANLLLPNVVSHTDGPTPWVVTAGSITLSGVTEERIEGTFRVSAQGAAISNEADRVTIVGSFIAIRRPL